MNCNLCGADDYSVVFPAGYAQKHRIVRCNCCSLMYANPQEEVDCETFAAQSQSEVFDPESPRNRQYYQKQLTQLPDNLKVLRVLNETLPGKGRLLEIGSYLGVFLDRIRSDGWQAIGLEPDQRTAKYAREHYGHEIIDGVLPLAQVPNGTFDAVVLLHVIEHMPDPSADLREIRRLLKPGGVLVVETPRFNSLLFKLLGRRERSIQNCQGHIFCFTEQTLRQILDRSGFKVFRVERVGRTLTLDRFLYNVGLVTRWPSFQRTVAKFSLRLHLDRVRFHVNVRDMQRMFARTTQGDVCSDPCSP